LRADERYPVNAPALVQKYYRMAIKQANRKEKELGRSLTSSERDILIREALPRNYSHTVLDLHLTVGRGVVSLDQPTHPNSSATVGERTSSTHRVENVVVDLLESSGQSYVLSAKSPRVWDNFSPLEVRALELRFDLTGEGFHELEDIAIKLGSSKTAVVRAISVALEKLRKNQDFVQALSDAVANKAEVIFEFPTIDDFFQQLTTTRDAEVLELKKKGYGFEQIANELGLNKSAVGKSIGRLVAEGKIIPKNKVAELVRKSVFDILAERPNLTLNSLAEEVSRVLSLPVTPGMVWSVRKRFRQMNSEEKETT
jgi:biotin operon repressor